MHFTTVESVVLTLPDLRVFLCFTHLEPLPLNQKPPWYSL